MAGYSKIAENLEKICSLVPLPPDVHPEQTRLLRGSLSCPAACRQKYYDDDGVKI
jgi:hypothetical protein